jgi:hypothetical protein
VVVIGGSLGGVAAASHAMQSGATTCLIELTPWLGGQISSQGVSAIDESRTMWDNDAFSDDWRAFKDLIEQQTVKLPDWSIPPERQVAAINSCWVGRLCFPPHAGASAAQQWLRAAVKKAPRSQWSASTAFKGAEFDATGKNITAIYAVRRVPRSRDYMPEGWFSRELKEWYSWDANEVFDKVPLKMQAPPGKRMIVIDATDTAELVGWADIPHRLGSESKATTGEFNAVSDNPSCTGAFTFPFVLAIHDDGGTSLKSLANLQPAYSREEHEREFSVKPHPMFEGWHNFFNYRRIVSNSAGNPFNSTSVMGDMTLVNWNRGNDWNWMNPPLLLTDDQLDTTGQRQNWFGGLNTSALRSGQEHALLFAEWLITKQAKPQFPLTLLVGKDSLMGTVSGLSMIPYFREGRRILGRKAYGQDEFMLREADLRVDYPGGRDFGRSAIAVTHYAIDMHGCRDRNWHPSGEASAASVKEKLIRPLQIPLESLIPQGVDNMLIGGKGVAATHIANAVTRIHYSEWSIGAAAGVTAGWLVRFHPKLSPADIPSKPLMGQLQKYLLKQRLRFNW